MAIDKDINFIADTPIGVGSSWDYAAVTAMSCRPLPDAFLGDQQPILQGDQYRLWLRWFLEGLVSPVAIARNTTMQRLHVFEAVLKRIKGMYPSSDLVSHINLSERITDHLFEDVIRIRESVGRDYATKADKAALLAERNPPRCYICGFVFPEAAQDALIGKRVPKRIDLPSLVDIFRPRLINRDVCIEIEHVVPVAQGGQGFANLRLACGWCNKYKSSKISLYEASQLPSQVPGFKIGDHEIYELPHPFWTIRVLALRKRCQHPEGCSHTANDAEMFVSLVDWGGSPNPINLKIFCKNHDPMAAYRLHPASIVAELWGKRR